MNNLQGKVCLNLRLTNEVKVLLKEYVNKQGMTDSSLAEKALLMFFDNYNENIIIERMDCRFKNYIGAKKTSFQKIYLTTETMSKLNAFCTSHNLNKTTVVISAIVNFCSK